MAKRQVKTETVNTFNPWFNLERVYMLAVLSGEKIKPLSNNPIFGDFKLATDIFGGKIFDANGSINYEFVEPKPYNAKTPEIKFDMDKIHSEIEAIKSKVRPTEFENMSSETLIRSAMDRADIKVYQLEMIKLFASVFAQMEGSETIKLVDTAEALQFSIVIDDAVIYNLLESEFIYIKGAKIPVYLIKDKYQLTEFIKELETYL